MPLPEPREEEQGYLVTVVVTEGRHRLRPTAEVTEIFETALGRAQELTDVEVHCCGVNTNHYHLVATDVRGELPVFMRELNQILAVELNRLDDRSGPVFLRYQTEPLDSIDEFLNAMTYALTNTVKDGLSRTYDSWPGYVTKIGEIGGKPRKVTRGESDHKWSKRSKLDESYEIRAVFPRILRDSEPAAASRARLGRMVKQWSQTRRAEHIRAGNPGVPTRHRLETLPIDKPRKRPKRYRDVDVLEQKKRLSPLRKRRDLKRKDFREKYARALAGWIRGERDVVFPYGTYEMVRFHDVAVEARPPPPS